MGDGMGDGMSEDKNIPKKVIIGGKTMPRYLTVVYEINDNKSFKEEIGKHILEKMISSSKEPWSVSAMSLCDEIHRLHLIEQAIEGDDCREVIGEICSAVDIESKTLADFS